MNENWTCKTCKHYNRISKRGKLSVFCSKCGCVGNRTPEQFQEWVTQFLTTIEKPQDDANERVDNYLKSLKW